jgi:hypothetical protein
MSAVLMHGDRGGEGRYQFDVGQEVADGPAMGIAQAFMAHLDAHAGIGPLVYDINAALKHDKTGISTILGTLHMGAEHGDQPFAAFIAPADAR